MRLDRRLLVAVAAAVMVAGCSTSTPSSATPGSAGTNPPGPTVLLPTGPAPTIDPGTPIVPATEPPEPGPEWTWPPDGEDDVVDDPKPVRDDPQGNQLAGLPEDEPTKTSKAKKEEGAIEPCELITTNDWFTFAQEQPAAAILEDGDACGWENRLDDLRLALGVFRAAPTSRWLGPEDKATGTAVDDLGDRAYWLQAWPVPQSSTLVIEVGNLDVVLEVSTRGDTWPARALETAVHFGELVLGRLP